MRLSRRRRREVVRQARIEQEEATRSFREVAEALPDPVARALMLAKADELDEELRRSSSS